MKNSKMKFSKKVLICLFIFLLLFTITMILCFYVTGNEPSTLITCVFAACIGEFSVLGFLKNCEYKYEETINEEEQEE